MNKELSAEKILDKALAECKKEELQLSKEDIEYLVHLIIKRNEGDKGE